MDKILVAAKALLCFAFSLTAPLVVPFALMFTSADAKALAWSWYDTPDEPNLVDLNIPAVAGLYARFGWFVSAWYWFGFRNRAHGFASLWSSEALAYWPKEDGSYVKDGKFMELHHFLGPLRFEFGWPVYASKKYPSGLEFRPTLSVKWRPVA